MFFAIAKAIGVTIGFVRIGAVCKFFTVIDAIAIAVRFTWIGAKGLLLSISQSIVVRVVGRVGYDALGRTTATIWNFLGVKRISLSEVLFAIGEAVGIAVGLVRVRAVTQVLRRRLHHRHRCRLWRDWCLRLVPARR